MLRVGDLLANSARRYPEAVALVDRGGTVTFRRLAARAWALARGLSRSGVRPGQTVGVLSGNSAFAAETYLGIAAAGAVAVPYNWRWATPELVFALNDSGARVLLVERAFAEAAEAARATGDLESLGDVVVEGQAYEALLHPGPRPPTGGGPDDPHLVLGATSVLLREFDEELVAATIERERVTNGFLVPSMVRRLLASGELERHDLSSYRRAYVGGAAFGLDDKLALTEAVPGVRLYYQYGLTEAGPIVTRLQPDEALRPDLDGSIGREFLLTEVTVRAEDGAELGAGAVGELCVRGPNVMLGYLGRPHETAAALRGGLLRTGDLASHDESGYLWFHDRAKDMIKSGGENVYSAEVERVLLAHPEVAEAAVIGVASGAWDEEVRAVVCLRPGGSVGEAALRDFCRGRVAGYKVPKRIAFVERERMPFNQSGKVLKTDLRRLDLWG